MRRANKPGKKVGQLMIKLDRTIGRGSIFGREKATLDVELRLDSKGIFHAFHGGRWFSAATQKELHDLVKASVILTVNVTWERYLIVHYSAEASEIIDGTARTQLRESRSYSVNDDRADLAGDPLGRHWSDRPHAITGISLEWDVVDYSSPYHPPEYPEKLVRMKREISWIPVWDDENENKTGEYKIQLHEPDEQGDDSLPASAVVWTAEREALLVRIRDALGKLDAKLVALFRGGSEELASKIDRAHALRGGAAAALYLTEGGGLT